jgi:Uma2 family endonuclease
MTTQTAKPPHQSVGEAVYWLDADSPGLPITLDLRPLLGGKTLAEIDFEQLWAFIEANELYAIEYNETGELIIMPPMYMPGGNDETELLADVKIWQRSHGGVTPSSATIFRIPGLGGRGPDASWVSPERLAQLDPEQYRTGQICPDFVAEIRSPSNTLAHLQRKMGEYLANGARLGWIIDPRNRRVTIYRPGQYPETLENPEILFGEDVMVGFEFRVRELIFDAAQ